MHRTSLKDFDNGDFNTGKNFLTRGVWFIINALFINSYCLPINSLKIALLKIFGAKIGIGVVIKPKVNIKYPWRLSIGDYSWIGENVWIDNLAVVAIGSNCCISQGTMLLCGNHNFKKSKFDLITKPIILEDGAWVGAKSVVCPGVTMKVESILTVNSVATADLDSFYIYQGNPAVKIKKREIGS